MRIVLRSTLTNELIVELFDNIDIGNNSNQLWLRKNLPMKL